MVKIFPTRFILENGDTSVEQLWLWVAQRIQGSKITKIVPLEMEQSSNKGLVVLKGLVEAHCSENVTTREIEQLLKPYPPFIQQIYFTFQ